MMLRRWATIDDADAPTEIMHPGGRSLFSYWEILRGQRHAPQRHEVDLRSISTILPWLGVLEDRPRQSGHRWRLAGTGIGRLWGRDLTGSTVAADWPVLARRALSRALDGVTGRQQPFVARLKAVSHDGEALGLEYIAVPVATDDGRATHALSAVLPFQMPKWLGSVALVDIEVRQVRTLAAAPLPGQTATFEAGPDRPVRLTLIAGGRAD